LLRADHEATFGKYCCLRDMMKDVSPLGSRRETAASMRLPFRGFLRPFWIK
jgi:hypothetical protein